MTQVSVRVVGPTAGDLTVTYDLSDADGTRILTSYAKIYGPVDDGNGGLRPMTPTEIVDRIASGFLTGVVANTIRQEQAEAAQVASAAVPPIPYTPGQ